MCALSNLSAAFPFFLICGPCVIEGEEHCIQTAARVADVSRKLSIPLIFKASFDKANRTSIDSYRGPGLKEGLRILKRVKCELKLPVLSDVHETAQIPAAAEVLDVLQIPAFLCRQTDLVTAAAASGRIVNIKKGQFLAPWDVRHILEKARQAGARELLVTERGVSFGYNHLVVDFKSIPILKSFGVPVVFDATHSVQLPGGGGHFTSGHSEFIPHLARAAAAVGVDGFFIEVHEDPEKALSDGPNALRLDLLEPLLRRLIAIVQSLQEPA